MPWRILLSATILCLGMAEAFAQTLLPPIIALDKVRPEETAIANPDWRVPIQVRSEQDAGKYFTGNALKTLIKQVDFQKQFVLVLAWKGSGQDRLEYTVAESFPEQITFSMAPGKTFDLRSHAKVFALRANVKWGIRATQ